MAFHSSLMCGHREGWVIRVAFCPAAIKRRRVWGIQECIGLDAFNQIRVRKAHRRDGNHIRNTVIDIRNPGRKARPSAIQNEHAGPVATNFPEQDFIAHMRDVQVREPEATQLANQSAVNGVNIVFCDVIKCVSG